MAFLGALNCWPNDDNDLVTWRSVHLLWRYSHLSLNDAWVGRKGSLRDSFIYYTETKFQRQKWLTDTEKSHNELSTGLLMPQTEELVVGHKLWDALSLSRWLTVWNYHWVSHYVGFVYMFTEMTNCFGLHTPSPPHCFSVSEFVQQFHDSVFATFFLHRCVSCTSLARLTQ